eukprot:SAG31_NODE_330_length_17593_cov_4.817891_15_plen_47_part_00
MPLGLKNSVTLPGSLISDLQLYVLNFSTSEVRAHIHLLPVAPGPAY